MTTQAELRLCAILLLAAGAAMRADPLIVRPDTPLDSVREKLANDPAITEVIFQEGTYRGGLRITGPKNTDLSKSPLLIRAADNANVTFDGAATLEKFEPVNDIPGVFQTAHPDPRGEAPKLWEPKKRIRYRLVADRQSVARFPATFTLETGGRLLFHTSDGKAPDPGHLLISAADCGLFVNRPHVTVRGLAFQNYLAREKWSTAVDLRVDYITALDCTSTNCSHGFIVTGNHNTVRRCTANDVGGGVYVGGANATVEACRFHKRRDAFMVPMYAQDDTGIQYYAPARGGNIRGNLCAGFGMGVFIKATEAPYVVEHNTLVGLGQGLGFGATNWHEGERFRYNIIADCDRQIEIHSNQVRPGDVDFNCYWSGSAKREGALKPVGQHDLVADPKFAWPQWNDYRLANDSPCLKLADESGPAGAFAAVGDAPLDLGPPRQWHVSESGTDGRDGTPDQPIRTIQFAVDRAKPGDTILIHPGIYPDPVRITRGGVKDKPITLRAARKWSAILDSNRAASTMIGIDRAPHVQIHDLEIRWYADIAIRVHESPDVTVTGCKIWNAHWHGAWPTGTALRIERSRGFVGRHNLCFRQEHAFWFYNSPAFSLTHNTCAANLYSAAAALYSCENSVCRYNSFAFQRNDVIVIEERAGGDGIQKLKTFDCDHNNYATHLRRQPEGTTYDSVTPRKQDSHLSGGSKAIVNYNQYKGEMKRFVSLAAWREFSGLDQHTIFADPLYTNTPARDFHLDPASPNLTTGATATPIGALGPPEHRRQP